MKEQKIVLKGGTFDSIDIAFKSINQLFSQERKFITHKKYEVTNLNHYTSFGISTLRAIQPNDGIELTSTDLTQSSAYDGLSGIYQKTLWGSLKRLFASDSRLNLYPTASVLSIPVYRYGFEIKPKSINIKNYSGGTTNEYTDKKVEDEWGTIVSSAVTYGYVFYRQGLIVMTNTSQNHQNTFLGDGNWDYTSNRGFTVNYKATKAVEEVSLLCHVGKDEFNKSSKSPSSTIPPYITTIGLYNDDDEMVAVAKLGSPLKKSTITDLFINVKFDID